MRRHFTMENLCNCFLTSEYKQKENSKLTLTPLIVVYVKGSPLIDFVMQRENPINYNHKKHTKNIKFHNE